MEHNISVLIGENSLVLGSIFSATFNKNGISTVCRRSDSRCIMEQLAAEKTDVVILSISAESESEYETIRLIKQKYPEIKIITLSYVSSRDICKRILDAGAELYMLMPVSMHELVQIVKGMINQGFTEYSKNEAAIAVFLSSKGIPVTLKGFRYLCASVNICIENPESLDNITEMIYNKIAKTYRVTPQIAERSLRFLASAVCRSSEAKAFISEYYCGSGSMTNRELISIAADAYAHSYNLFFNEPVYEPEI